MAWSDIHDSEGATFAYGTFKAEGGAQGGNGGRIETSGHYLSTTGIDLSAAAPNGKGGEWLLDPYNITVNNGGVTTPVIRLYRIIHLGQQRLLRAVILKPSLIWGPVLPYRQVAVMATVMVTESLI